MADTRRGKKTNTNKNYVAAKDFADGKKIGRTKQKWVWDHVCSVEEITKGLRSIGHWEKL